MCIIFIMSVHAFVYYYYTIYKNSPVKTYIQKHTYNNRQIKAYQKRNLYFVLKQYYFSLKTWSFMLDLLHTKITIVSEIWLPVGLLLHKIFPIKPSASIWVQTQKYFFMQNFAPVSLLLQRLAWKTLKKYILTSVWSA